MSNFDPKTKKYPYPDKTDKHYLKIKKNKGIIFDEKYPYIDKSRSFLFKQKLIRFLLVTIVFPFSRIKMGLKIKGKENLDKNIIKNGVISCSNHIHMWDYIAIMKSIRPIKPYMLVWDKNVNGENGFLVRMVGGIPIPSNPKAVICQMRQIKEMLNNSGWLHIYAEGAMWEYYYPIRPFKRGVAFYAIRFNKPIIPFAFSYRKPSWIRKHIFRQPAAITLNIGAPIFKDESLSKEDMELDLTKRCHAEVCRLASIDNNIYPPIFNEDNKIDYY